MDNAQKLKELRQIMKENALDGFLVPHSNEYQAEFPPECVDRLKWLTGFTGSAGTAIVAEDTAMVMTDGRYTIQLAQQVDQSLFDLQNSQETKMEEWIVQHLKEDAVVGYDPKLYTKKQIESFEQKKIVLKEVDENLIDQIWTDRPEPPKGHIRLFPEEYAGQSAAEKISQIQNDLKDQGCDAVVLSLLESVSWVLNIRGTDVSYTPVVFAYLIVPLEGKAKYFGDLSAIDQSVSTVLDTVVDFFGMESIEEGLKDLSGKTVSYDSKRGNLWFFNKLQKHSAKVIEQDDPCIWPRSAKNAVEQQAMRKAHIRDGVAMVRFLKWLDGTNEQQTELSIEEKLCDFRKENAEYTEDSFPTIAGYGSNGAIVHYRATQESSKKIEQGNLLLLDSGAQYVDGTTDITRTIAIGDVSEEMKIHNTLVLQGHIAVATARFPKGTTGKDIDARARVPLQKQGLDFSHGTGHGVGCHLSVHEEAASLSPRCDEEILPGMILSNEPGYYEEGSHGIRIENLILTLEEDNQLYFETITLAPIDLNLVIPSMLSDDERQWLNDYHRQVFETLSPLLGDDHVAWLKEKTAEI